MKLLRCQIDGRIMFYPETWRDVLRCVLLRLILRKTVYLWGRWSFHKPHLWVIDIGMPKETNYPHECEG